MRQTITIKYSKRWDFAYDDVLRIVKDVNEGKYVKLLEVIFDLPFGKNRILKWLDTIIDMARKLQQKPFEPDEGYSDIRALYDDVADSTEYDISQNWTQMLRVRLLRDFLYGLWHGEDDMFSELIDCAEDSKVFVEDNYG